MSSTLKVPAFQRALVSGSGALFFEVCRDDKEGAGQWTSGERLFSALSPTDAAAWLERSLSLGVSGLCEKWPALLAEEAGKGVEWLGAPGFSIMDAPGLKVGFLGCLCAGPKTMWSMADEWFDYDDSSSMVSSEQMLSSFLKARSRLEAMGIKSVSGPHRASMPGVGPLFQGGGANGFGEEALRMATAMADSLLMGLGLPGAAGSKRNEGL